MLLRSENHRCVNLSKWCGLKVDGIKTSPIYHWGVLLGSQLVLIIPCLPLSRYELGTRAWKTPRASKMAFEMTSARELPGWKAS